MKNIKPLEELLDSVRDIEGFLIGKDEDILALSDPPYYTACPNPYINDFIEEYGKPYDEKNDNYHRKPFVGDVSEGKNDPIYNAHSYHTKVPHKAIMKFIEHYTEEGDVVFDGFCGTGMTGVAAQMLNRKAILSDLSPAATFIAYNYNTPVDIEAFQEEAERILEEVEKECGWMYATNHYNPRSSGREYLGKGKINYTVWSDVFICPYCGNEIVFWDAAVDKENGSVKKEFNCPSCNASMKKTDCERATVTFFDKAIGENVTQAKQVPVLINYTYDGKRYEKTPDNNDFKLIEKIENMDIPYWYPTYKMMGVGTKWGDTWRKGVHFGITHVHHFYTKRNLWMLAYFFNYFNTIKNLRIKNISKLFFTSIIFRACKLFRWSKNQAGPLSGTLYIASTYYESSILFLFKNKKKIINDISEVNKFFNKNNNLVSVQSIADLSNIKEGSIDYIFTDPPFGDNLMYSELNFLWESWLKVFTNNKSEAIINTTQGKDLEEYKELMLASFKEYYRVLKPNRWMTVVFHNSKSVVWNAIQEAITKAGFVIANVTILDKKQGSFKQVTSSGAVKNDLVISAYKPRQEFEKRFLENAGENLEIDFIRMHLTNLPVEPTIERTEQMLYSKMLAYYVQRGYIIRYDSKSFYNMLRENFVEEDGYWFTFDQINQYREYKMKNKLEKLVRNASVVEKMIIYDEKSALIWLYEFLDEPKDNNTIHTTFTRLSYISQDDDVPELRDLLDNNFIFENEKYRRPQTEPEKLSIKDKREKELIREFEKILLEAQGSNRKIKKCRKEALAKGFEYCYKNERFQDILTIANKLDRKIIETNSELNEFIEVAKIKIEGF